MPDGKSSKIPKTAWVISDGTAGMEIQSRGLGDALAEAMGVATHLIRVTENGDGLLGRLPYLALLPPALFPTPAAITAALAGSGGWPDFTITTGRRMAGYAALIRRRSGGKTRSIHIQNPQLPKRLFDFLILPEHDGVAADVSRNILTSIGSLGAPSGERIAEAARKLPPAITALRKPLLVFMLGGSNKRYQVGEADCRALAEIAAELGRRHDAGLAFIPSRRTPHGASEAIKDVMGGGDIPFYLWDGAGGNPYPGILSLADAVIVTSDSVNMASEACSTGKPVYIHHFREERGRIGAFHRILRTGGYARDLRDGMNLAEGDFFAKPRAVLDETKRIARLLTKNL